jgi:co-chaperonin GroES (HSP10)
MAITTIKAKTFTPRKDHVWITDLDHGHKFTKAGLIIPDDDMTNRGIRARWGRVYMVGPDVTEVKVGQWIMTEHGRWTNKTVIEIDGVSVDLWRVDWPKAVMLVTDEDPRKESGAQSNPGLEFAVRGTNW